MKVLVTGANGFIGRNLTIRLQEQGVEVLPFTRASSTTDLEIALKQVDFIFHLAGINRPQDISEFSTGNAEFTEKLTQQILFSGRKIPILYTSSLQAERDNPYGQSKLKAEQSLFAFSQAEGVPVYIYRLPNVFGKWCRPNYNSVVATFCYNIVHGLPINIHDSSALMLLVYIDDVLDSFVSKLQKQNEGGYCTVAPVYSVTVGELAEKLQAFKDNRMTLMTDKVGSGFTRALYSTFISYYEPEQFYYKIPKYEDARGLFVEMLKTSDSGQFSFFTAHPGVTRGGHYHHTKTEKFLVIKGKAHYRFKHLVTGQTYDHYASGEVPEIVETIPGWVHDITNVGADEMIVMLWANEIFDRQRPDTVASKH